MQDLIQNASNIDAAFGENAMRQYIHAQLGDIVRQKIILPRSIAIALADCTSASVPLGLTPSVTWGCSRVAFAMDAA